MTRLVLVLALSWRVTTNAAEPPISSVPERVIELIQQALSGEGKPAFRTNSGWLSSLWVESKFREACDLMPQRADLRFLLATTLIGEATSTNGAALFDSKMREALATFREAWTLDPAGFSAPILYAAYARAIGDTNAFVDVIQQLMRTHPERTRAYLERFERVEGFLQIVPNETPGPPTPAVVKPAIVILGAALETNGLAKPKLLKRLEQGLKLARAYPNAPIIVTGGNQKTGITEAYLMSGWLKRRGIASKRIYLDDQAKDTVGNALYSATILQRLAVTDVMVVTSTSHMRRALVCLAEACLEKKLQLHFANLAAPDEPSWSDPRVERVTTYRDALRISGLWAYPGIQR